MASLFRIFFFVPKGLKEASGYVQGKVRPREK